MKSHQPTRAMLGGQGLDVCWEDKVWMQHFPLNRETVLDYFSGSPVSQPLRCCVTRASANPAPPRQFYDRTCNNEQVKMQRNLPPEQIAKTLERMVGIEYGLDHAEEVPSSEAGTAHSLYIIRRVQRSGPPPLQPSVQHLYYVLDGVVYEVPDLHALLSSRLQKLGWHLDGAFDACWAAAGSEQAPEPASSIPS